MLLVRLATRGLAGVVKDSARNNVGARAVVGTRPSNGSVTMHSSGIMIADGR